jgi:hypothetical protein
VQRFIERSSPELPNIDEDTLFEIMTAGPAIIVRPTRSLPDSVRIRRLAAPIIRVSRYDDGPASPGV